MKFKWDFLKRSPRCGFVWKLYASHPCALHTPFKRTESIWCAIMGIRTPLVHDTPLSVYCLTPQIKFYLCRKSVGNFRTLSLSLPLFFFFFCITFDTSPHNLSAVWDLSKDEVVWQTRSQIQLSLLRISGGLQHWVLTPRMFSSIN